MEPGAELLDKRRELARIEGQLAAKETERAGLIPGEGYGDAKARLSEDIRQLTKTSARLQREIRVLTDAYTASLQPKLL